MHGLCVVTALAVPMAPVPDIEPIENPGQCRFGGTNCPKPAEVQVLLPDLGSDRLLCRHHVGYFMLAGSTDSRIAHVLVRRLGTVEPAPAWLTQRGA